MYYLQTICCICLNGDRMLIKASNLHTNITSFYFNQIIGNKEDSKLSNKKYFCVGCFKTLKYYYRFANQCIRSKNMFDSYISELTNFNENLGLFNITISLTDIDPSKEVHGTIRTKPNVDFLSDNDLKLSDIFDSFVDNNDKNNVDNISSTENHYIYDNVCVKQEEFIIDEDCVIENGDHIEYEETPYDENTETYTYDFNRLQASTESFEVIAPSITTPVPKKPKKKIFRLSPISQQLASCKICAKKFQNRSHLETHLLTHTDSRPFACDICSKRFRQRAHLRTHKMIHFNIKPYQCQLCNKHFRQKAHLNAHILLHSDAKLFRCDVCEKFYRSQANLRFHRSSQHRIVMETVNVR